MSLDSAIAHLLAAKRVSAPSQSYAKDNPGEWALVKAYLEGGARPTGVVTAMGLGLIDVEDARRDVAEPPPDPDPEPTPTDGKLKWRPPALSSPLTRTLTNAARSVPKGSGDLIVKCGEVLTGGIGQVEGYNDVVAIAGAIQGGTLNSTGHICPREMTGTFHIEGWKVRLTQPGDFLCPRWRVPIVQMVACDIDVTDGGTSYHSDGVQSQFSMSEEWRFDRCTIKTDYQGIFMSNEPEMAGQNGHSYIKKAVFSRILFVLGQRGIPATYLFKAWPPRPGADPLGVTELYDVWAPDPPVTFPATSFRSWGGESPEQINGYIRYGAFRTTKKHANGNTYPFLRFSTAQDIVPVGGYQGQQAGDCGVRGDGGIWIGTPPANLNVGAPANTGVGYTSPGYV